MASSPDNTLHQWRSRAIDGFAAAEAAIDHLLRKANQPAKGDLLSTKMERLRKTKPWGGFTAERKAKVDQIIADLLALLPIRNDLVHAPMVIRQNDEHPTAWFANPNARCDYSSVQREISAPRLQALATKVTKLAKDLESA